MSTLGEQAYAAAYAALPEVRASMLMADGLTRVSCMCASVELTRQSSEFGQSEIPSCVVRLPVANIVEGLGQGKVVTLTDSAANEYRLRIHSRKIVSGLLALLMIAESAGA